MGSYFLDTSAIVKCYFPEVGHSWVQNLCNPAQGHSLYISQAALVEVVTTFCRKARNQKMQSIKRDKLISTFRADCESAYIIEPVTTSIYTAAGDLCRTHSLRAYDAVQLACALNIREKALIDQISPPIFICADNDLVEFACTEGFMSDNPNNHP